MSRGAIARGSLASSLGLICPELRLWLARDSGQIRVRLHGCSLILFLQGKIAGIIALFLHTFLLLSRRVHACLFSISTEET